VSFVCSSGLGSAHAVFPFTRRAAAAVFRGLVRYDGSKSYTDTTKEFKVAGQSSIDLSGSQSIMPVYSKFWSTFRMPRMEPLLLEKLDDLRPIVEASKAHMGFVPNSIAKFGASAGNTVRLPLSVGSDQRPFRHDRSVTAQSRRANGESRRRLRLGRA
jgi:hypothetical protein